jgi:hypothetical protein
MSKLQDSTSKGVYTIYDSKAKFYSTPFYSPNDDTAIREFVRIVNDTASNINPFPDDYSLFKIGTFSDTTGLISPQDINLLTLGNDVKVS